MSRKQSKLTDKQSWFISTLILTALTIFFHFVTVFEKTFFLYIFVIPTLLSILFSIYLEISSRRRR